jgi:hypothetical protein
MLAPGEKVYIERASNDAILQHTVAQQNIHTVGREKKDTVSGTLVLGCVVPVFHVHRVVTIN